MEARQAGEVRRPSRNPNPDPDPDPDPDPKPSPKPKQVWRNPYSLGMRANFEQVTLTLTLTQP